MSKLIGNCTLFKIKELKETKNKPARVRVTMKGHIKPRLTLPRSKNTLFSQGLDMIEDYTRNMGVVLFNIPGNNLIVCIKKTDLRK